MAVLKCKDQDLGENLGGSDTLMEILLSGLSISILLSCFKLKASVLKRVLSNEMFNSCLRCFPQGGTEERCAPFGGLWPDVQYLLP